LIRSLLKLRTSIRDKVMRKDKVGKLWSEKKGWIFS
jgi:hypothetical protein